MLLGFIDNMKGFKTIDCGLIPVRELEQALCGVDEEFVMLRRRDGRVELGPYSCRRILSIAHDTGADMLYSDYHEVLSRVERNSIIKGIHSLIPCQMGALRDDFDFGPVVVVRTSFCKKVLAEIPSYKYGAFYALRLAAGKVQYIPEPLYTYYEVADVHSEASDALNKAEDGHSMAADTHHEAINTHPKATDKGRNESQFDYVDPRNREVQAEMEEICTAYLKRVGAYITGGRVLPLPPAFQTPVTASVVIPVYNRARTVGDAVRSALSQECDFHFNVIVVDNHSDDGTSEVLATFSDPRLKVIVPEDVGLGIGGCWNLAINTPDCGLYAVQLDSDDIYSDCNTLAKIVSAFKSGNYGMVVGSYTLTDFDLNPIPPGLIDHKEWTDANGRNNALRINGLGAPRAFYVPLLRQIGFPDVSYGEDYAVALRISRDYRIGRIYESLYFCRRWTGNSDASLSVSKANAHNTYKDFVRTCELQARLNINKAMETK